MLHHDCPSSQPFLRWDQNFRNASIFKLEVGQRTLGIVHNIKFFPKPFEMFTVDSHFVVDQKRVSGASHCSVQKFELITKLTSFIHILVVDLHIAAEFAEVNLTFFHEITCTNLFLSTIHLRFSRKAMFEVFNRDTVFVDV